MNKNYVQSISNADDFYEFLKKDFHKGVPDTIYRGIKLSEYELVPSVGRHYKKNKRISILDEKKMLELFKQKAFPFLLYSNLDKLNHLSIAQHNGLPTRLLDWTWNPLAAFYFAVRDEIENEKLDSAVFIWKKELKASIIPDFDPFDITEIKLFVPTHVTNRIAAQSGLFSIHPKPYKAFQSHEVKKVIIKNSARKQIKSILRRLGVHEATLFPDVEGVAKYVKYLRTDSY